ncbi:alpha/beta fold hydrolase [Bradyrhizobium sp. Ai1a-2]|uniref:alpha/beta fold hydrolase n=1 Tax=Bradyrhizobium sp. Ai1a-2 TaxID=196490 RepID=UPI00048302C7|nr:alpha/beta fold hydrolase [Bradyrhizobium sp. Ai1a-2]
MIDLPGGALCYVRMGKGPAVVLVHGIPLSLATWRHNLTSLADNATVVAFDLRGFGRSEKPSGDYSVRAHARVLGQLLDALCIPSAALVGSSYGCAAALQFARDCPDRVQRLVLINSVGYPATSHSIERFLRIGAVAWMMQLALSHDVVSRALFAYRLRRSYASSETIPPDGVDGYYSLFRRADGVASFLATLRQFDEAAVARLLPDVQADSLILWGDQDRVLPVWLAKRIQAALPRAYVEILPGCGHLPHEEAPARVNALIAAFLNSERSLRRAAAD